MLKQQVYRFLLIASVILLISLPTAKAEEATLKLDTPAPRQVIQRTGLAPGAGYADVPLRGTMSDDLQASTWEYRVLPLAKGSTAQSDETWKPLERVVFKTRFEAKARVLAGGWYRLELRGFKDDKFHPAITTSVEPIGVGEVFLVAGQSYATNCNDEQLKVTDPLARVVAFNVDAGSWGVAHDPQPTPDRSNGGSIWPPLGDALVKELHVPVAFVNVAFGGTSSAQWMPEGELHPRLVKAGQELGNFRAILWQQGESDVIAKTTTEKYIANLAVIRETAAKTWGFRPPWLLAKSTHHPTVYNDPDGENRIRKAIDEILKQPDALAGPDTDALRDDNRGDSKSRRHFSAVGQKRAAALWLTAIQREFLQPAFGSLKVGIAEADITPPLGFPMAGYYHERLAEGSIDPLKAKAIVFQDQNTSSALVVCDLIGIATDLSREVRRRASEKTGIPVSNIVVSATHTHTAPDYMKELYLKLGGDKQEPARAEYIDKLINGPVDAIVNAQKNVKPSAIQRGAATQQTPVSFNRRFVMRDGSVRTWMSFANPEVVRSAGPIDPEIGLLAILDEQGKPRGVLSNFALHLDTVGGSKWSADYPFFIEQHIKKSYGPNVVSIFATGCCGDINHSNPHRAERNKTDFIGGSIAKSIQRDFEQLQPVDRTNLVVKSKTVSLPLQDATKAEVAQSIKILDAAKRKESVDFLEHVTAYKKMMLDHIRHREPFADTTKHITWGVSRSLKGIGENLPVDVTVMTFGQDLAIVCLPGEVFVELGMAIKQGSPYNTTLIVELSNCVETIYIPHRAAYAGGSYEVTNSSLKPGSGEILVETALGLLREAASSKSKP